ncbi:MAG: acetate/propionate family kinase [Nanoarchaeota archaeon]
MLGRGHHQRGDHNSNGGNTEMTTVMVINSGSSSLKCKIIDTVSGSVALKAHVDGIGLDSCTVKINDKILSMNVQNHTQAISVVLEHVDTSSLDAVGHRVVHGGETYARTVRIDNDVIDTIRSLSSLAPLHNPANLQGILACKEVFGDDMVQVAVFDTAFHQSLPEHAYMYGLDKKYYSTHGIRKYGFHGTSHKFVATKTGELICEKNPSLITCHIGNGSSITAIKDGRSIDTSMGFTPMPGVVMGTRCGDLDPGIIGFLQNQLAMNDDEVMHILNNESGLKGLAGSSDMRDLHSRDLKGDKDASLAIEKLSYDIARYVGFYSSLLGEVDGIIFTAGLGENAHYLRKKVFEHLPGLGVVLDDSANERNAQTISASDSSVPVYVIPTDEELQIALETSELLKE